jgi:2-isopropylmalate synthase
MPSEPPFCPTPAGAAPARTAELLHDWNQTPRLQQRPGVVDETLRDGLQSPSAADPPFAKKVELLERAAALGVDCFALGFPASRQRQFDDALGLARHAARERLPIELCCAARTLPSDIRPVAEIAQRSGLPLQIGLFIGSSPIRRYTESWSLEQILRLSEEAVGFAVSEGLSVLYVTEDSTRSPPEALEKLYSTAIRAGAQRICVADTVGHATPEGAGRIVGFAHRLAASLEPTIGVEWHGHRDRGLDVANCLAAWSAGAERCHGTALGIGERAGNAPIEQLLVNLALLGWRQLELANLPGYVQAAAEALGVLIPEQQPVVGRDAFRTATGAHAAAVGKALALGDPWVADRVFSGVPAALVGRVQELEIGPGSGEASVVAWLAARGIPAETRAIAAVLAVAKQGDSVLSEAAVLGIVNGSAGQSDAIRALEPR